MSNANVSARDTMTLTAVAETIGEGTVLHVRADRMPAKRQPRRDAMPAADFTVGPDARGGFLVVDYSRVKSGEKQRYETADEATRWARRILGWDRMQAFRVALLDVHGEPARPEGLDVQNMRQASSGAALHKAFGHRRPLVAPLFGGCGVKV